MPETHLVDLDELVLTVRDRNSREYLSEAIANYRTRSYRSALIATWVAVAYDIISKIRELALQGDKAAGVFVADLEVAIALQVTDPKTAVRKLQDLEEDLLNQSIKAFEFISPQEAIDLQRLKSDRNLCAHPAFVGEALLYQPSPELVRTHIVHSITHLLQHPPVQGKHALDRMLADVMQPSFPTSQTAVSEFLEHRYLNRAKQSLLERMVVVFLKTIIKQSEASMLGKEETVLRCLLAVSVRHPTVYERKMTEQLPKLTDGSDDAELKRVLWLFKGDRRCWGWLSKAIRLKLEGVVGKYSYSPLDIELMTHCLDVDELRPLFLSRIAGLPKADKQLLLSKCHRREFIEDAILLYSEVNSFRTSEAIGETIILPMCSMFSADHLRQLLSAAETNVDIYDASGSPAIFSQIFERTIDLREQVKVAWQSFLASRLKDKKPDDRYAYPGLRKAMEEAKIWPA